MSFGNKKYFEYYTPLIEKFRYAVKSKVDKSYYQFIPGPFLPQFGQNYMTSRSKIVFMGIDTSGWCPMSFFLDSDLLAENAEWKNHMSIFQKDLDFRKWSSSKFSFFGFILNIIAQIHGVEQWPSIKKEHYRHLLSSFAWANEFSIEQYETIEKKIKHNGTNTLPILFRENWEIVRQAGCDYFDGASVIFPILDPDFVIILNKSLIIKNFAKEYKPVREINSDELCESWSIEFNNKKIQLIQIRHPNNLKYKGKQYIDQLVGQLAFKLLIPQLKAVTPSFIKNKEDVDKFLQNINSDGMDKFNFIIHLAERLCKVETIMNGPMLANVLKLKGFETNYGADYKGTRGIYRLIKSCYNRALKISVEAADNVAKAFVKSDGTYAYK